MEQEQIELLKRAVGCLDKNEKDGFRRILERARTACADDVRLMGEVLLLSAVGGEVGLEDALRILSEAERMIGGSSRILTPQSRFAENHFDAFLLWGRKPGSANAMLGRSADIKRVSELFQRLTGFGAGISECYQAQLAYYRGNFDEAARWAGVSVPEGSGGQISLINVYLLEILAGIAKHTMDQKLWRSSYGRLKLIASGQQSASRTCREQAEVVCAMLDMSLGCLHDVPAWMRVGDFGVIPAPHGYEIASDRLLVSTMPSAMVAHMEYLCYSGEPVKALQTAAMIRQVLDIRSVVLDAYSGLLRAGCYFELNRPDYAQRVVREAMEIIVADGLWEIAAEFVPVFGEALYAAAREHGEDIPEKIRSIGEDYWNKLTPLRNEMLRGSAESLARREQEVMSLAMKGHSNAEIAAELNVAVRTVKFHLGNVYQKLNITRRSKFVGDIEQDGVARLAKWVK